MVEPIGPNRISSITPGKPVARGKVDKSKRDSDRRNRDSAKQDREKPQIGGNIDEHC